MSELLRTALYETHKNFGARLVPFAGWEMPVQYAGVMAEVRAVRESCGIFDVSHMGQFFVSGEGATDALNRIVSADWSQVAVGRAAYALLLNESGGVIDDVMGYHLDEDYWLVVVNASRAEVDEAHFRAHLSGSVRLEYWPNEDAMLAIQGPDAARVLASLCDFDLNEMKWRDCRDFVIGVFNESPVRGILARGGYTGCDGFELILDEEYSAWIWDKLVENGAVPCGLGARDVLRLEAGLPLYGHELRESWTPAESGIGFAAKIEKPQFIGRDALIEKGAPQSRIRGLMMEGRAIPRDGYRVLAHNDDAANVESQIGEITSGTMSVALNKGIALAMLPTELEIGDLVDVEIRGVRHAAKIVKPPFVATGRR